MNAPFLRQEIEPLIASGDHQTAARLLTELWTQEKSFSSASFLISYYEQLRPKLSLLPCRLAILRSFTVEPMVPLLRAAAFNAGIDLALHLSDFNAYAQEILDPQSALYAFSSDAVILALQTRDVAPDLWHDFSALTADQVQAAIARVTAEFRNWVRTLRNHSEAHLVIHNLEQPTIPNRGVLDARSADGQNAAIQQINRQVQEIASGHAGVYVLDYDSLVARYGRAYWHDERKWLTVRLPIAVQNLNHLVNEWLRFLCPLTGKLAKVLVVDLDNTLWGGVIGEDGMANIHLGDEYPGAAFQELQRALLDLHHRGILLAICSKNNRDDAMEALQNHPGMLLKTAHFAAMRINWSDKAHNLREIAGELNIGVDSLAFLDDNSFERQEVTRQLPEVCVIDLPRDPMDFARAVRECPLFERLSLSAEDQQRGTYYRSQREREQLEQSASSREDFYRSLLQEAEIAPLTNSSLARIAQLTNKTNQFNLTTRRYTEQQISQMASSPGWHCFSIRLYDRFGDNGLVGVAITHQQGTTCEIDTLLLSCRVIGRTVESAFLAFLATHARKLGSDHLHGWFVPTKKNAPARDFYSHHGFQVLQQDGDRTLWGLDIAKNPVPCPEWVKLRIPNGVIG